MKQDSFLQRLKKSLSIIPGMSALMNSIIPEQPASAKAETLVGMVLQFAPAPALATVRPACRTFNLAVAHSAAEEVTRRLSTRARSPEF